MAEVLWYYSKQDKQLGPVSPAELKQLAAARTLLPEDLIWREGMDGWAPAARVKGLFPEAKEPLVSPAVVSNGPTETMPPTAVAAILATAPTPPSASPPVASASAIPADVFTAAAPSAPISDSRPAPAPVSDSVTTEAPGLEVVDLLWLGQIVLWTICIAVVFLGGLLFTVALMRAETVAEEGAAGAVFATFFVGAYVVARAGERIAALLQAHFERRRK